MMSAVFPCKGSPASTLLSTFELCQILNLSESQIPYNALVDFQIQYYIPQFERHID